MENFTPVSALLGGMLIGTSATILLLFNGEILGGSGHGICGIARFSTRSIVATLLFMTSGMITVYLVKHLWGGS